MKPFCCFIFSIFMVTSVAAQSVRLTVDSIRKYRNIPGLVYAVFNSQSVLDSGATGLKKAGSRGAIDIRNRFQIGTSTTALTTFIAARMVHLKKISWNTTIIQMLPELKGSIMKVYHSVTLSQLLTQRAGIVPFNSDSDYRKSRYLVGSAIQQRLQLARMILQKSPVLLVDSTELYFSAASVIIASCMLEKAGRKKWEDLVAQYIAQPLHITVGFGFPGAADSSQPRGHWVRDGVMLSGPDNYNDQYFPVLAPASGAHLSLRDYIVFIQEFLKALEKKSALLGEADANRLLYEPSLYAMGWSNGKWKGEQIAYWMGSADLYTSYMEIFREKGLATLIMCNNGSPAGRGGVLNLARFLREFYTR